MLGIYTRLSSDDDKGNSIENQIREGKQFAKQYGFQDNYKIYNEGEGVSGRKELEDRPILFQLVKDISVKKISAVWFRHQNRLDRNNLTFQLFAKEVKKAGTKVFFADKEEDFNDPNSMFQLGIMSLISTYQAELTGVQVKKVLLDNVKEGKVVGGIPFGFKKKGKKKKLLIVCPENSEIVKQIYVDYLSGMGTTLIAKKLNEMEVPTLSKNTQLWKDSTVLYILKNALYIGKRKYGGKTYKVEPIISNSIFDKVQLKIENSGTKKGKKTGYKYLLNGLIICGHCGEEYLGRSQSHKGYFYYICKNHRYKDKRCSNRSAKMEHLDELIWSSLFRDSSLFREVKSMYKEGERQEVKLNLESEIVQKDKELVGLERKKNRVVQMVENEILSISDGKSRIKELNHNKVEIEEKINRLKEQKNSITNEKKLIEDMRKDFPFLTGGKNQKEWEAAGFLLDADVANEERIKASVSFKEKQKLIQKYIESIKISYLETDNEFEIEVAFKIPLKNKKLRLEHNLGRKPRGLS
tara:strand:- start:4351 stop:5922 length:1572 start_codon:yes stop_codon:yes gene_type:complete